MSDSSPDPDAPSFVVPRFPGTAFFAVIGLTLLVLTAISAYVGGSWRAGTDTDGADTADTDTDTDPDTDPVGAR